VRAEWPDVTEIRLHVLDSNERAQKLYEKHGFVKTAFKPEYPHPNHNSWRMVKLLPPPVGSSSASASAADSSDAADDDSS
jgi:ribosomal protein S18 acetylase RimI-like enzyme